MGRITNIRLQARALWARLASHFKKNWTVDDYPVDFRFPPTSGGRRSARLKPLPWSASVVNWPGTMGAGGSKSEALGTLRKNFGQYKLKSKLPRPGAKAPVLVQFASTNRVNAHSALAKEFIKQILELDWAWISDESTLFDFHNNETNQTMIEKIRSGYGVDVSDISSGNLADIFDRIAAYSHPVQ